MPTNPQVGFPVKKVVIVDNSDHIPGITQPQPNSHGSVVSVSGDRVAATDRHLPAAVTSRRLPSSSDIKLPSLSSSTTFVGNDQANWTKLTAFPHASIFGPAYKGPTELGEIEPQETTFSTRTIDFDEPIPHETPEKYDRSRKYFSWLFCIACLIAATLLVHVGLWVFYFGDGLILAPKHTFPTKRAAVIAETRVYYHIHMMIMLVLVVSLQGFNTLIYRLLPKMTLFKVKCVHASIGFVGAVGAAGGVYFAVTGHNTIKKDHFHSAHSNLGIFTFTAYQLHFWSAFVILMLPFPWFSVKMAFIPLHKFLGSSVFVCAVATAVTGTVMITIIFIPDLQHTQLPPRSTAINSVGILALMYGLFVTSMLGEFTFRRRMRPVEKAGDGTKKEGGSGGKYADRDDTDSNLTNSTKASSSSSLT